MTDGVDIPESSYMKNMSKGKKEPITSFEAAINEFKEKYLRDQIHPDNQTEAYLNNLRHNLNQLLVGADERDRTKPGEGIFGLIALCLRSILVVKDELVRTRAEMKQLRIEIHRLQKQRP